MTSRGSGSCRGGGRRGSCRGCGRGGWRSGVCFEPGVGAFDGPAVAGLGVGGTQAAFLPRQTSRVGVPSGIGSWRRRGLLIRGSICARAAPARGRGRHSRGRPTPRGGGCRGARGHPRAAAGGDARSRCRREPQLQRCPVRVYGEVVAAAGPAQERARDLLAPFLASTSEASTITRDQSSWSVPAICSANQPALPPAAPGPTTPRACAGRSPRSGGRAPGRGPHPGSVRVEHVQDALQASPRGITRPARVTVATRRIGKQRLQPLPQLVRPATDTAPNDLPGAYEVSQQMSP